MIQLNKSAWFNGGFYVDISIATGNLGIIGKRPKVTSLTVFFRAESLKSEHVDAFRELSEGRFVCSELSLNQKLETIIDWLLNWIDGNVINEAKLKQLLRSKNNKLDALVYLDAQRWARL